MNTFNLFPTAVGFAKLDRDITQQELDFIVGQKKKPNNLFIITAKKHYLKDTNKQKQYFLILQ